MPRAIVERSKLRCQANFIDQKIQDILSRELRGMGVVDDLVVENSSVLIEEHCVAPKGNNCLRRSGDGARYLTHVDMQAVSEYDHSKKKRKS